MMLDGRSTNGIVPSATYGWIKLAHVSSVAREDSICLDMAPKTNEVPFPEAKGQELIDAIFLRSSFPEGHDLVLHLLFGIQDNRALQVCCVLQHTN